MFFAPQDERRAAFTYAPVGIAIGIAKVTLRTRHQHDSVLPKTMCDDRPWTDLLVLAQIILRTLQVYVISNRDLCADLVERRRTCFHVTRERPFEGPVKV